MEKGYVCDTCRDTGKVSVANGPSDFEEVVCPDCAKGLEIMESDEIDMSGADNEGGKDR